MSNDNEKDPPEGALTPEVMVTDAELKRKVEQVNKLVSWWGESAQGRQIYEMVTEPDYQTMVELVVNRATRHAAEGDPMMAVLNAFFLGVWVAEMGKTTLIREKNTVEVQ